MCFHATITKKVPRTEAEPQIIPSKNAVLSGTDKNTKLVSVIKAARVEKIIAYQRTLSLCSSMKSKSKLIFSLGQTLYLFAFSSNERCYNQKH